MCRNFSFVCVAILLCTSITTPAQQRRTARLLFPGQFHGEEVIARSGERWLGFFAHGKSYDLRPVTLRITRVHDPVVDDTPSQKTGKKVAVNRNPEPVFLVRGVPAVTPGMVETSFLGSEPLSNITDLPIELGGVRYRLMVNTKDRRPDSGITLDDAKLVIGVQGQRQVIYALGGKGAPTEAYWSLVWAGDLDQDSKLDLLVDVTYHYNLSQRKLFLSGAAGRGKMVKEVASFEVTGC